MSPWSIFETIIDAINFFGHWRFTICLFASIFLAFEAAERIPTNPLHWLVPAAIVLAGVVIGWRWDGDR